MLKYKDYIEEISRHADKMQSLSEIFECAVDSLKTADEDAHDSIMLKLHCLAFGPHFNEELAKYAVDEMVNVDQAHHHGETFSREKTDRYADQLRISEKWDFYYLMNMFASDYYHLIGNNENDYARYAEAYLADPDAEDGKAFKAWQATHS